MTSGGARVGIGGDGVAAGEDLLGVVLGDGIRGGVTGLTLTGKPDGFG